MNLSDITIQDVGQTLRIEGDPHSPYKITQVDGRATVLFGPVYASIEEALRYRHRPPPSPPTIQVNYYPEVEIQEITVTCNIDWDIEDEINGV